MTRGLPQARVCGIGWEWRGPGVDPQSGLPRAAPEGLRGQRDARRRLAVNAEVAAGSPSRVSSTA